MSIPPGRYTTGELRAMVPALMRRFVLATENGQHVVHEGDGVLFDSGALVLRRGTRITQHDTLDELLVAEPCYVVLWVDPPLEHQID